MHSIKVLDVTLRDGGCVNDFNFGNYYMRQILTAEETANIECIEVGYLDNRDGSESGRTKFSDEKAVKKFIFPKKDGIEYLAMMDYGKFDVNSLEDHTVDSVDSIRVAFHKKDSNRIVSIGRKILEKGYKLYIQPMLTIHYKDSELLELIKMINEQLPNAMAVYIVDSFGEMRSNDVVRLMNLFDHNLLPQISLGFHSHNNLQLSYSNAILLLQFQTERDVIVDSSILGMGKGAGNLNTELLLEHMNIYYGKHYRLMPLMELIDNVMSPLKAEYNWGYSIEYYLSSKYHISPSYANYFYNKHSLSVAQLSELLDSIDEAKKISFDSEYAKNVYRKYKARHLIDDTNAVNCLKEYVQNRPVVLIAPGKSTKKYKQQIEECISSENAIVIGVNSYGLIDSDYVLLTRVEMFKQLCGGKQKIIVLSNITDNPDGVDILLNYTRWIINEKETRDSAGIISLRLMEYCKPSKILLAGFDGFSCNLNENYYDETMRFVYSEEIITDNNKFLKQYITLLKKRMKIEFITPSIYEE